MPIYKYDSGVVFLKLSFYIFRSHSLSHSFHHFPEKMSPGKSNHIRRIVRIRQMVQQWRKKARISASRAPSDVPAGHVAVCVGASCKRFIVRATHLNHPIFKRLLVHAEEEYGFANKGPLAIPCDESFFEEVLRVVSSNSARFSTLEDFQSRCHVDIRSRLDLLGESRPLLHTTSEKSICWISWVSESSGLSHWPILKNRWDF